MGIFKRSRRPSLTRVAEGGGGSSAAKDGAAEGGASKSKSEDLGLFGADSDESDDDATIDRYANGNGGKDGEDDTNDEDAESRKVSTLLSKMTPEELFTRYDTDGSGNISLKEFLAMLPDLGIKMSEAKAIRIFKRCDTDGGGEIDLTEFKAAMFAVDPVSGNTLGFAPSNLLAPRDAFELFDTDGTGKIDEDEFADVLEYFGMNVSDEKQETMFKKYDKDKSGYIDYREFRSMWIRLSNVREELTKRGVEIPKYATPWKLQSMLEKILDEEEAREAEVLAQAERFRAKQREKQRRALLGHKAMVRAQDELAAALDAAGQVYVLGTGRYKQYVGQAVPRNEDLFPGFKAVSEIWSYRVDPQPVADAKSSNETSADRPTSGQVEQKEGPTETKQTVDEPTRSLSTKQTPASTRKSKYVRRRPENMGWGFHSPPKLNAQSLKSLKERIKTYGENDERDDDEVGLNELKPVPSHNAAPSDGTTTQPPSTTPAASSEDVARLFFQDREYVRSLRFQSTVIMKNTGSLWGRGVLHGALSNDLALAATSHGSIFTWGGKDNTWETGIRRVSVLDDSGDSDDEGGTKTPKMSDKDPAPNAAVKVTPRSAMIKMSTADQLKDAANPEIEEREEQLVEAALREEEEEKRYNRLKTVVIYYDMWEPPPSNATRVLFMEQVLLPKLDYETMMRSAQWRGLVIEKVTKMELILLLGECFELEREIRGEDGHTAIKTQETLVKQYMEAKDKQSKAQCEPEKAKLTQMWDELRAIRADRHTRIQDDKKAKEMDKIHRTDAAFEAMVARRHVQHEDLVPELTSRGINPKIELSGITSRGPPLHSPRGRAAITHLAAGGSHAAILMHGGQLFTWGVGSNGRLGRPIEHPGMLCQDATHPQVVEAFQDVRLRQVSCGYSHSAAVGDDGALYVWGSATNGKLGVGVVEEKYEQFTITPLTVKFPGTRSIRSVSCGAAHTGAVTTAGELFMWGCANGGRLGLGPQVKDVVVVPTLVRTLVNRKVRVWQVACGHAHSALCTEITSELRGGSKKLLGGQVFVCGGALPLGRFVSTWEIVPKLNDIGIRQVSCGVTHTAAVSAYGELYTWGRNENGCTGHSVDRQFIHEPELLRSLHVEPYNLALGKPCRQINVYNEQGPQLAVNGDIDGRLERCIHTHLEDKPWWEVNLGQPAVIERIRVWNRTDEPANPSKRRDEYSSRMFPFWILISEFPFKNLEGKEGLRAAKVQSTAFEQFEENRRMTEWILPTAQTVGQYIRIQLQGRNFLHLAEVEVFGVYSAFNYVGRVGYAHCGDQATLVIVPPNSQAAALDDYYLRAIQADADNATILRQFEAFERSYRRFGRGDRNILGEKCRLCRVFKECEICEFQTQANIARFHDEHGELPKRLVGDRMGLSDLVKIAIDERGLEAEVQERESKLAEEAQRIADEAKRRLEEAAAAAAELTKQHKLIPTKLLKALPKVFK